MIPVGEAWNRTIADGIAARNPYQAIDPRQINLWAADSYHASVYGSYLEALVIFGSVTGHDPRELGARSRLRLNWVFLPTRRSHYSALLSKRLRANERKQRFRRTLDATPIGTWNLVVAASDEFDGSTLDAAKWKKGLWYDTSGVLAFKQENIAVSGGNLVLTARKEAFNEKSYTFGAVESLFDVPGANSYVEVRAKALHRNANVLSAIWLQSSPLTSTNNPNPEIDIQETFNYHRMDSTLHTWAIDPATPTETVQDEFDHTQTAPK